MGTFLAFMGLLGSLITGIISYKQSQDISNQNVDLQQQTNEKNEELMHESWERDDTAIQRSKADALAAGFSPLVGVNGAPNSGPITLSAPQATAPNMSGLSNFMSQMLSAGQSKLARDQMDPIYKAQAEQMNIDNDSRRLSNILDIVKATKEIEGLDLSNTRLEEEIKSMLGDMLANEVISADDLKGTRWEGVAANKSIDREYKIRETANANTAYANQLAKEREDNRKSEAQREFDSNNNEFTSRNKVSYTIGGLTYELELTDKTSGKILPASAGVDPKAKPSYSTGADAFSSRPNLKPDDKEHPYYVDFYGVNDKGLPCYVGENTWGWKYYYVAVPSKYGISYYEVDKKSIYPNKDFTSYADGWSELLRGLKDN